MARTDGTVSEAPAVPSARRAGTRTGPSGERLRSEASGSARAATALVDVDLLAPDLVGHLPLLDLRVLVEPHALLRHGPLLGDGLLGVQHDLVLLLGDL